MELLTYLERHFYTRQILLELTHLSQSELDELQARQLMPLSSYRLKLDVHCDSFFGPHHANINSEYYAKGYVSWLAQIRPHADKSVAFDVFSKRYRAELARLKALGHNSLSSKLNQDLARHIESEWDHFLNGTYGLCTRTGLPEDIAAKEMAIAEIEELVADEQLDEIRQERLNRAVLLLDGASSLFAPHERARSSRYRLVDEVRRKYRLPVPTFDQAG